MLKRVSLFAVVLAVASITIFGGTALAGKPGTGAIRDATLTGGQVVTGSGDPDGMGNARLIFYPNKNKICATMRVSNVEAATSAHLHQAPAGRDGPVRLRLEPPRDGTSEHECIRGLGRRFIKKVSGNPSGYYVDVHDDEHPGGALRGQLAR